MNDDEHLLLDSRLARLQPGGSNQPTHDFMIRFPERIRLYPNQRYKIALKKLITMTYSWHNVAAKYNNNQLKWRKRGEVAWKTLTIPDGMYNYINLASFIQAHAGYVDKDSAEKEHIFNLYFDLTIYRVVIGIAKGDYELDLSVGEFGDLLGFDKKNIAKFNKFRW